MKVLFVGSGAVNYSLAGWLHPYVDEVSFLVRTADNELIAKKDFQCQYGVGASWKKFHCNAFATLDGVSKPDLVIIGVKSYALNQASNKIIAAFGNEIPIVSVLNGVRHVEFLTQKFKHATFATIFYNAYRTAPTSVVVVGGSVALSSQTEKKTVKELEAILSRSIPITLIDNPMDVAHCKLIFNLGNALMTMVAFHENRSRQLKELQQITANIMWEGVQVLKKHGVKEVKVPGLPSWKLLRLSLMLPSFIAVPIFKKKMEATAINSMAQDLEKGSGQTELEDLNGYFIGLAERVGVEIPYNKAIYEIFRMWELSGTQSLTPAEVLEKVNSFSNR